MSGSRSVVGMCVALQNVCVCVRVHVGSILLVCGDSGTRTTLLFNDRLTFDSHSVTSYSNYGFL